MVFKQNLRIPKDRADGRPGFVKVKRGDTPEEHGFTPAQVEELAPLLMDGERVTAAVVPEEAGDTVIADITAVIRSMIKGDPEKKKRILWTAGGKPRVRHIEKVLEHDITDDQRDDAWSNFKEGDNR